MNYRNLKGFDRLTYLVSLYGEPIRTFYANQGAWLLIKTMSDEGWEELVLTLANAHRDEASAN